MRRRLTGKALRNIAICQSNTVLKEQICDCLRPPYLLLLDHPLRDEAGLWNGLCDCFARGQGDGGAQGDFQNPQASRDQGFGERNSQFEAIEQENRNDWSLAADLFDLHQAKSFARLRTPWLRMAMR